MKLSRFYLILILGLTLTPKLYAGGSDYMSLGGARIFALNGLYTAGIDGAAGIIGNPASLSSLGGFGLDIMLSNKLGQQTFNSQSHGYFETFRNDDFTIHGGAYWKIGHSLTIGLGYYPVLRYNVDWPFTVIRQKGSSSIILAYNYKSKLETQSLTPAISYQIGPLAIGASINLYHTNLQLDFPRDNPLWYENKGLAGYQFSYNLSGWGYGFTFGLSYQISQKLDLAASIRSSFSADLEGNSSGNMFKDLYSSGTITKNKSNFKMPWILLLGGIYKISDDIAVNIDARYNLWSAIKENFKISFDDTTWSNNLSKVDTALGISGADFNSEFNNSLELGVGLEYASSSGLYYRAGYRYSESPLKDETFSMLFCNVDQHWFTAGIGVIQEMWELDITVAYSIGVEKKIQNENLNFFNGGYNTKILLPVINLRYKLM